MPWGFAAAAAATIGGAVISSNASQSAADTQANAANNATNAQLSMFNTTQSNLAPYMQTGNNALGILNYDFGLGSPGATGTPGAGNPLALPSYGSQINGLNMPAYGSTVNGMIGPQNYGAAQYQQSPGYQWQLSQGLGAISNASSAQGGIQSGNTLKELTTYGQGLANQDYQQAYQNYLNNYSNSYNSAATNYGNAYNSAENNANTSFNRLQTLAGSGQNAAANLGSLSSQTAGQIGSNIIGAGNAVAAGQVGSANALTGGINNLSQLAFLYQQNPNLFSGGGGAGYNPSWGGG
jgi:hypothetical protein